MKRRISQIISAVTTNAYWQGFLRAAIYRGRLKYICHPGMQCYSCPSSVMSCPVGALQNAAASLKESISTGSMYLGLYVIGFMGMLGALFGRLICGWLCPFGLLQELLYKIPTPKFSMPKWASFGKFLMLFALVLFLPAFLSFYQADFADESGGFHAVPVISVNGTGVAFPWYCKIICPVGTLEAGVPRLISDPAIRNALGLWFRIKWTALILFLLWIILTYRAFCRAGCPLGAVYGLFNQISLYRLSIRRDKCSECGVCAGACPMDIKVYDNPNHHDCIRCLGCVAACKFHAIENGFQIRTRKEVNTVAEKTRTFN
ncbi:MAG: 4Fe-4S binding protein [Bacillota bacterium]